MLVTHSLSFTSRELRDIEGRQEREIQARETAAREHAEAERLASSFVEHLDGDQLYESMWQGDESGKVLMLIGASALELTEEYEKDVYELTQRIYKLGLERFSEREEEVKAFTSSLEEGQQHYQTLGQQKIEDFLQYRDTTFEEASEILRKMEQSEENSEENSELCEAMDAIRDKFDDALNEMWQDLMEQELHLHEAVEVKCGNISGLLSVIRFSFAGSHSKFRAQYLSFDDQFCGRGSDLLPPATRGFLVLCR